MEIEILKRRHSLSHILAQALQREIDSNIKLGVGPAIDNGFYYDVLSSSAITEENLSKIDDQMKKIVKENQTFNMFETDINTAIELVKSLGQDYKVELIQEFAQNGETKISFYYNTINANAKDALLKGINPTYISKYEKINEKIKKYFTDDSGIISQSEFLTFIDICEGPHVENTNEIDSRCFKLEKIAGAYWRGDSNKEMMTRVYGLAFETKDELKSYINLMEEAKKRDHRILGKQLKLFTFSEQIGPGLTIWLPKGNIIKEELEKRAKETEERLGYQRVTTPIITKENLFYTSEHLPHYKDSMYAPIKIEGENYYIKPMNCPFHHKVFESLNPSYKDLPMRIGEYGWCHRYEDSGSLFGLMRVRGMSMNDAHIYCRRQQAIEEFVNVIKLHQYYYDMLGIKPGDYFMELALRNPENKKYHGDEIMWKEAEELMREAMEKSGVPYIIENDGAAFYGPKIDFQIRTVTGKTFTASTNQIDLFMPGKFGLSFINEKGEKEIPVCIHRAPLGTHERFIGFLIEHFAGLFPLWLAPEQIKIVPVADVFNDYAFELKSKMSAQGLRVKIDNGDDSFSKKIRNAEMEKVPLVLIVGEKEKTNNTLSVRDVKTKEQYESSTDDFIATVVEKVKNRSL